MKNIIKWVFIETFNIKISDRYKFLALILIPLPNIG